MGEAGVRRERLLVAEARERARLLRIDGYDVELDLRPLAEEEQFRSRTTVRFTATEPGATTFLDLTARKVERVLLNSQELPLAHIVEPTRLRLPGLEASNEVVVEAEFDAVGSAEGLHRAVDSSDGKVYAWTTFEPFGAHLVFACFDQPDLRAPFRFRVTAPDSWRVVSNNPVENVEGDRWTFAPTPAISTYLTVVCAGPYAEHKATHRDLPIGLYCRASLAPYLDVDTLLELTRTGLDHFAATFGTPYPFEKYDHVFAPEMNGAMENAGCVTYTDHVVFRAPPSPAQQQWLRFVVMHEMAHMWFGDLVTPVWWDDLWLKESFADWAGLDALARAAGNEEAWANFLVGSKQQAYILDGGSTTHPVSAEVDDVVAGVGRFDAISYQKGASLLKQLAALVGETALEAGLRDYFERFALANTRLDDLLGVLESHTDQDLRVWADRWLRTTGFPRLSLEATGEAAYERVVLRQQTPAGSPAAFPLLVGLGLYDADEDGRLTRRRRIDVLSVAAETDVSELSGERRAAMLLVNDDDLAFAGVRLDDRSLDMMLAHAHTLEEPLARGLCASLASDMVRAGELAVVDQVELVARMVRSEKSSFALESLLTKGRLSACWYADPLETGRLLARLGDGLLAALDSYAGDDPRTRPALLGLCSVAVSETQLRAVESLQADPALDANLRWAAVHRLVALARVGPAAVGELRSADPDPDVELRVLAATGALPSPQAKEEVWAHVFAHDVPAMAMSEIGRCFWQPGQEALLTPYSERWVAEVKRIDGEPDWQSSMPRARRMAPDVGVDEAYVARLRDLAGGLKPAVAKTVHEIADERARRLHARRTAPPPRLGAS